MTQTPVPRVTELLFLEWAQPLEKIPPPVTVQWTAPLLPLSNPQLVVLGSRATIAAPLNKEPVLKLHARDVAVTTLVICVRPITLAKVVFTLETMVTTMSFPPTLPEQPPEGVAVAAIVTSFVVPLSS